MKVLVDTSVWSLALRRRPGALNPGEQQVLDQLLVLLDDDRVALVGPIRQELLSGLRSREQFELLRERLAAFVDEPLVAADFERAAEAFNACRAAGVNGTPIDLLLCAAADRREWAIFTTDRDFDAYAGAFPVRLHAARAGA